MKRFSIANHSMAWLLVSAIVFPAGAFAGDLAVMDAGILIAWVSNLLYGLAGWEKRKFYIAFQITFFTFLLGRTVIQFLTGLEDAHSFPEDILWHTNLCLYVALLSLRFAYPLFEKRFPAENGAGGGESGADARYESPQYRNIRLVSQVLFYVTFACRVAVQLETMRYLAAHGIASVYVEFSSRLPYAVVQLSDVCQIAYFLFLATMPSRKEFALPTILYMGSAVLGCLAGKRGDLVVPILTYVLYCLCRNRINRGPKPWFTHRAFYAFALASPFLVIALYTFSFIRMGKESDARTATEKLVGFFDGLGFSRNVISYEKLYEDSIPDKFYSIGDTVDYLRGNVVTLLFFPSSGLGKQTVERALQGHTFAQTITYLYSPRYYALGHGLGSCYIAEAYHDFGYFGIVLWSVIYCFVLKKFYSFEGKGIVSVALALLALKYLLIAPRNMASAFFTEYVNVNTWLTIAAVFFAAHLVGKSGRGPGARAKAALPPPDATEEPPA